MAEPIIREPERIRQDCVTKLLPIATSGMFTAILGCLLGEDWATPRIEQLNVTTRPDNSGILRGDIQIRALVAKDGKPAS